MRLMEYRVYTRSISRAPCGGIENALLFDNMLSLLVHVLRRSFEIKVIDIQNGILGPFLIFIAFSIIDIYLLSIFYFYLSVIGLLVLIEGHAAHVVFRKILRMVVGFKRYLHLVPINQACLSLDFQRLKLHLLTLVIEKLVGITRPS